MSIKKIMAWVVVFAWVVACGWAPIKALGLKPVLVGLGMGVLIVAVMAITVWAHDALFDKYSTHYGANPP